MLNKKGGFGLPFYFPQSLLLFVLTLIVFGILFFGIGITQNPNLVIGGETYQDSYKLFTILNSPVQLNSANITIIELMPLAYEDELYKEQLESELKKILSQLPRPGSRQDYWNIDIKIGDEEFISLGDRTLGAKDYYKQQINLPLNDKKLAKISLYLNCLTCTKEDLERFA